MRSLVESIPIAVCLEPRAGLIGAATHAASTAKAKKRSHELLEQVGLSEKYGAFPADLSGGQKQRVAIARALAGDPGIILADEPTAALDSHTGRNVMEMMSGLAHTRGRAVVIVTHDSRVLNFADRIVQWPRLAASAPAR